jgi:phosphatidylglycerophosphate synthase
MAEQCVVLADSPGALTKLCGISTLERLLRTLQRCGFKRAIVLSSTPEEIAQELARPSWARAELDLTIRARPAGPVTMEHVVDLWPDGVEPLLILPANSVLDQRLLRMLASYKEPAALVDSAVPARSHSLVASAPATKRGRVCGPALLQRDWARSRTGPLEEALRTGLEDQTLAAVDVAAEPLYYAPLNRKLRAYWFPAPSPDLAKLAKRVLLDSAQKGTLDFPATIHAPIETFLVSKLCETSVTPNELTILTNVVAWSATFLLATGRLGWGLALAVIVGVLDGLDGKQARVKVETTKHGKLEHWFDAFFEVSWWMALAYYFHNSGQLPGAFRYLALLLFAQGLDGILKSGVRFATGKSIEELGTFERLVHLVGGRRNVMIWLQTVGFLCGAAPQTFMILPWLVLATAILHLPRAAWVFCQLGKGPKIEGTPPKASRSNETRTVD